MSGFGENNWSLAGLVCIVSMLSSRRANIICIASSMKGVLSEMWYIITSESIPGWILGLSFGRCDILNRTVKRRWRFAFVEILVGIFFRSAVSMLRAESICEAKMLRYF